jgi:DNA-binding NtrC family response regulator
MLEAAKRLVLRSNHPLLLADIHSRVGQAEAQTGELQSAQNHLHRAVQILDEQPNFLLLARTKLALSSTSALLCRNDRASSEAKEALKAADTAGSVALSRLCRANLAQLQFRTGALDAARQNASALLESPNLSSMFRLAILETYVASVLETEKSCEALSTPEVQDFLSVMNSQEEPTWVSVEAVPTQARALERLEGIEAARCALAVGRTKASMRGHHDSQCRLALIDAELALRSGDTPAGEQLVAEATSLAGEFPSAELTGLLERARALVAACNGATGSSRVHFGRSYRVLRGCGLRTEARRSRRLQEELKAPSDGLLSTARKYEMARLVASSDAAFLASLSRYPRVLASEFVHLARRRRLVRAAEVRVGLIDRGGPPVADEVRVQCGNDADGPVSVWLVPESSYVCRQTLTAMIQVVSNGVLSTATLGRGGTLSAFFELEIVPSSARGLYVGSAMRRLFTQIRQVARTDLPVLITGETGTGKEVVAAEVHALSKQADKPFIALNVTAVPREMLEGQLFGYRRGAFTGAVADARGLIREAEGGTLFIDEIGELSPDLQPKLLRFLESGEIQPLGERPQRVEVRIVAATNAHLLQLVDEGRFREDLFYRLNVVSLAIPPLRERREEIPTLIHHFLTRHARDAGRPIPQLSPQALERLSAYDWPGNVRQLTNELKRIVALHDENELVDLKDLSAPLRDATPARPTLQPPAPVATGTVTVRLDQPLQGMYDDVERAAIPRALKLARNNQTETANRLGITRKGLYLKRRRLGLDDDPE